MNLFLCVCVCMTVACNREMYFFFLWLFVVGGLFLALNLTVPVGLGSDDIGRVRAVIFSYT